MFLLGSETSPFLIKKNTGLKGSDLSFKAMLAEPKPIIESDNFLVEREFDKYLKIESKGIDLTDYSAGNFKYSVGEFLDNDLLLNSEIIEPSLAKEIVFIDQRVDDYETLIADIGNDRELVFINSQTDGVLQIHEILSQKREIEAIHIVSHGQSGELQLGSTQLSTQTLEVYADYFRSWQNSFAEDADTLIYGCNFAADDVGEDLIHRLSELTGTDVAASNDLTGGSHVGGNWAFEVTTGEIEAAIAFSDAVTSDYSSVLATFTGSQTIGSTVFDEAVTISGDVVLKVTGDLTIANIATILGDGVGPLDNLTIEADGVVEIGGLIGGGGLNNLNIEAEAITLLAGATVSSRQILGNSFLTGTSTQDSGDIRFDASNITFGEGAALLAQVEPGSGFQAGDITLAASVETEDAGETADGTDNDGAAITEMLSSTELTAAITIDSATLLGNDITVDAQTVSTAKSEGRSEDSEIDTVRVDTTAKAEVSIQGNARLASSGNLNIQAQSTIDADVLAEAKDSDDAAVDAAIALADVNNTAIAHVSGDTTLAANGEVKLLATTKTIVTTTANGVAGGSSAAGATVAVATIGTTTEAYISDRATITQAGNIDIKATALEEFKTQATSTAGGASTNSSSTQNRLRSNEAKTSEGNVDIAAALAVTNLTRKTQAYLATNGRITTDDTLNILASSHTESEVIADGTATQGDVGVGVGMGINRINATNDAYVSGTGDITADRVNLAANTGGKPSEFTTKAMSGAGKKSAVGIAGALALNLVENHQNRAAIAAGSTVQVDGADVTLTANSETEQTAEALPQKKKDDSSNDSGSSDVGVGASVAVNSANSSTRAEIEADARLIQANTLTLNATSDHEVDTKAEPGAAGGIAVDAVVAVAEMAHVTQANIAAGKQITTQNGVTVTSKSKSKNTMTADANAAGESVGIGAAVAVVTSRDQTQAEIARSLKAEELEVTATSERANKTTAKASAKGAQEDGANANQNQAKSSKSLDQYGANTSEGAVQVAAAVAVADIQDQATATVSNGEFDLAGKLTLKATNQSDFATKGEGNAKGKQESEAKVGVGVGINITDNLTTAALGPNTTVQQAGDVHIRADSQQNISEDFKNKLGVEAIAGASKADSVGVAGALAISRSTDHIQAFLADGTTVESARNMQVESHDKSRLSAKAHAQNSGSDIGVGASVAILSTTRHNQAYLGEGTTVNADSLTVMAKNHLVSPEKVDFKDFKNIVDNLKQLLRTNNNYTEAIAGGTDKDDGTLQVAGSFAINKLNNTTATWIESNAVINIADTLKLTSQNDTQSKAIAGNIAANLGGSSLGLGSAAIVNTTTTRSDIQAGVGITSGNIEVTADADQDVSAFGISVGVGTGKVGIAGVANVVIADNITEAFIADSEAANPTMISATGNLNVKATNLFKLRTIAGGAAGGGDMGFGLSTAISDIENITRAYIGQFTSANVANTTHIEARNSDDILAIAAGGALGGKVGIAGSTTVTSINNETTASINPFATLNQASTDTTHQQTVTIIARDKTQYLGTGGAVSVGGKFGFSGGIDILTLDKDTLALVKPNADVYARDRVSVQAMSEEDIISVAASLAVGGTAGIAGSVGVSSLEVKTKAEIGDNATVYSEGSVLVAADIQTEVDTFAGSVAAGGTAGFGASVAVPIIKKETTAEIGNNANVTAKGLGDGITARTGNFDIDYEENISDPMEVGGPSIQLTKLKSKSDETDSGQEIEAQYSKDFPTLEFNGDDNTITREFGSWKDDGFNPGQKIHISDGSGLNQGSYVIDTVSDNGKILTLKPETRLQTETIQGANVADRLITGAVELTTTVSEGDDETSKETKTRENRAIAEQRIAAAETTQIKGLAVTATNQDDLESYAIAGSGASAAAIAIAGNINVLTNETIARIEDGAKINSENEDASSEQSILVAAGSDLYHMGINGSAALAGSLSLAPAAGVAIFSNTTEASIGNAASPGSAPQVNTNGDVQVVADSNADILSIGMGVGISGKVAIAGSISVLSLDNSTKAFIDDSAIVQAGGDVLVSANDDTKIDVISGAAGIGILGGGIGASVGVVLVEKNTQAYIGQNAVVDAGANSPLPLGILTGQKPDIPGVSVQAKSREDIFNLAVAGGAGLFVGVAGAVTVDIVDSDTQAFIGQDAQINQSPPSAGSRQDVRVTADNTLNLLGISGSAAGGLVGLSGGVDVGIVRNDTSARVDEGVNIDAQRDVIVQAHSRKDIDSYAISGSIGGFVGVAGAVAVHSIGANPLLNFTDEEGQPVDILATDDEREEDKKGDNQQPANQDVQSFADEQAKVDKLFEQLTPGPLAEEEEPSEDFKESDNRIVQDLGNAKTSSVRQRDNKVDGAVGRNVSATYSNEEDFIPGTSAVVGRGVSINAGNDVTVAASGTLEFNATVGAAAVAGFVGAGGSVAATNVAENVQALVEDSGDRPTTITAGGDITVESTFDEQANSKGFAGGAAGLVGLGAQVAIINDQSSQRAAIGDNVEIAQADKITVKATADKAVNANSIGGAAALGVAVGVSIAKAKAEGLTEASVGKDVQIGQVADQTVGSLTVDAIQATSVDSESFAVSAGIVAGSGSVAEARVTPEAQTRASIGAGADINLAGNAQVTANAQTDADSSAKGFGGGVVKAGISEATSEIRPTVEATVGDGAEIAAGGDITVSAQHGELLNLSDGSFNATGVDSNSNTITFDKPHGLRDGSSVEYSNEGGKSIGGLEDGSSYNIIRLSDTEIRLGDRFDGSQIDIVNNKIRFAEPHGFEDGDEVIYENSNGPNIGGLISGQKYYVRRIDEFSIQLASSEESATQNKEFRKSDIDSELDEIRFGSKHNFVTGQRVIYRAVSKIEEDSIIDSNPIAGLANGHAYFVIRIDDKTFKLANSPTDAQQGIAINIDSSELESKSKHSIVSDTSIDLTISASGFHSLYFDLDASTATEKHRFLGTDSPLGLLAEVDDNSVSSANATGTSGGLISGEAATANLTIAPTVKAFTGNGSSLTADGKIDLSTDSAGNAVSFATNRQGAGIAIGKATTDVDVFNSSLTSTGEGSAIDANGTVSIRSNSAELVRSAAKTRGVAGVTKISSNSIVNSNHATKSAINQKSHIFAGEQLFVEAVSNTDITSRASSKAGGGATAPSTNAEAILGSEDIPPLTQVTFEENSQVKASQVVVNAEVENLSLTAHATSRGTVTGKSTAKSVADANDSLANLAIRDGASITGSEKVELNAQHTDVSTQASGKALLRGPGRRKANVTNDQVTTSSITTEPNSQLRTKDLLVQAGSFASADSYNFETDAKARGLLGKKRVENTQKINRIINFNSNISPGANPVLEVDEEANVVKACNVTIDDIDGKTLGPVLADQIIVNDISNDDKMTATFRISELPETVSDQIQRESIGRITGNPRFLETYDFVKLENRSDKDIVINDIEVINKTKPNIIVEGAQPDERGGVFATDPVADNLPRLLGPTLIDIHNSGASEVILNGVIDNPHDTTQIRNTGGNILSGQPEAEIATRVLNLSSEPGKIGDPEARVTAQLIQGYAIGEGYGLEGLRLRDPSLQPDILLTATANESIYLDLQGIRRDDQPLVINSDRISTNLEDVNLVIQQGLNGDGQAEPSTYQFGLIQAGGDVIIDAENTDTTIIGNTDILSAGKLDVITEGNIDLTEMEGELDIARVESTAGDITLTVQDSKAAGEDLILDSEATVRAPEGVVNLRAGDDVVMAMEAIAEAKEPVTIQGDFGNADVGIGSTLSLRGIINALRLLISGDEDDDRVNINEAQYTESRVDLRGGNDTFDGGGQRDVVSAGEGDDFVNAREGNDSIYGNDGDDTLLGGNGNDEILGGAGDDLLSGGSGDDDLSGGGGHDQLQGDEGHDTLRGEAGRDRLTGGSGDDLLIGGEDDDTLEGQLGDDELRGGVGADDLSGGEGDDQLYGEAGADVLAGGADNDSLYGGDAADVLLGEAGDDWLSGDAGDDYVEGGEGADTFYMPTDSGLDIVADFEADADVIDTKT
mgnify:CR=1 FL=1